MRIIARLDIKTGNLIKSVKFDGQKKIGTPEFFASNYYENNIDELIISNNTGSLFKTLLDYQIIKRIRSQITIPISAGGGITSINDAENLINHGCDKIIINSLLYENPKIFSELVSVFGSSSIIGSIQYNKHNKKTTYYKMAREQTGLSLADSIKKNIDYGCGEILLTEISNDGTYKGLDLNIIDDIQKFANTPFLIGGGFGKVDEIINFNNFVSAIVISSSLHYSKVKISDLIKKRNLVNLNN